MWTVQMTSENSSADCFILPSALKMYIFTVWDLFLTIFPSNVFVTSRFQGLFLFACQSSPSHLKSYVRTIYLHEIDRGMESKRNEDVCYLQKTEIPTPHAQIEAFLYGCTSTNTRCSDDKEIKGKGAAQINQH